jgi:hypothetical protein
MDAGFSVELLGRSDADGWAVVCREAGMPRTIMNVYLTRDQAETAAARLQDEVAKNT